MTKKKKESWEVPALMKSATIRTEAEYKALLDKLTKGKDDFFYIFTPLGGYAFRRNSVFISVTPAISSVRDDLEFAWIVCPPIPKSQYREVLDFFRAVWYKHRSEAIVLIYFNKKEKKWRFEAPEQEVSSAHVNYEPIHEIPKGYVHAGTIHSHCNFGSFQSGTDNNDARHRPGLHVVIGHVDSGKPTIDVSLNTGTQNWDIKERAMFPYNRQETEWTQKKWLDKVKSKAEATVKSKVTKEKTTTVIYGGRYSGSTNRLFGHGYLNHDEWEDGYADPHSSNGCGFGGLTADTKNKSDETTEIIKIQEIGYRFSQRTKRVEAFIIHSNVEIPKTSKKQDLFNKNGAAAGGNGNAESVNKDLADDELLDNIDDMYYYDLNKETNEYELNEDRYNARYEERKEEIKKKSVELAL